MQGYKWLRQKFEAPPEEEKKEGEDEAEDEFAQDFDEDGNLIEPEYDDDGNVIKKESKGPKRQDLVVLQLTMKNWSRKLSNCIQNGTFKKLKN